MVRSRGVSQSQVQVRNKARSKPPSTSLRSKSCSGTNRLFFSGSGRNVWHWRSPQYRSKNELLELARPCCFAVLEAASPQHRSKNGLLSSPGLSFGKPWRSEVEVHLKAKSRCEIRSGASPEATKSLFVFNRFRPQRLTLQITPAQVSEVSPAAAQIVSFLAVPATTFDTEDHPSTGQKTSFLSSPGHAVLLFWRLRFGKPWLSEVWLCRSARPNATQLQSISKPIRGAKRAPNLETFFFRGFRRNVWHWRSPQRRSQKGVLLACQATLLRRIEASVLGKSVRSVWHRTTQT